MSVRSTIGMGTALALAWSAPALAQEIDAPADPKPRAWRLQATPGVWYMGLGGDLTMPGGEGGGGKGGPTSDGLPSTSATMDLIDLGLDGPELAPGMRLDARLDPWRLTVSGFTTSVESTRRMPSPLLFGTLVIGAGETVETQIDYSGLEFSVGYRFWEKAMGLSPAGRVKALPSATVFVGARLHDVGVRTSMTSGMSTSTQDVDETFVEPIAGLRLELELYERATLDLQVDGGYSGPSASWSIWAGFQYRPLDWLGLYVGYRHLGFDLETGSGADRFQWDGAAAGLGAGMVMRF